MRSILTTTALAAGLIFAGCSGQGEGDRMASARAYLAKNDNAAAIVQLKAVLQQQPDLAEARFLLGKALLASGDPVAATVELRKTAALNDPQWVVAPPLARSLLAEKQFQRVVEEFSTLTIADAAARADVKTSVASALFALGRLDEAQREMAQAEAAMPDYAPLQLLQSRMALRSGNSDEALARVEKAIATRPGDVEAWHLKGGVLLSRRDFDGSLAAYRKAVELAPGHPAANGDLLSLLIARRDLAAAAEHIAAMRKREPGSLQAQYYEAMAAFVADDQTKARELIRQVTKVAGDEAAVLQLAGSIEFANGAVLEAQRSLEKALLAEPGLTIARRNLAMIFLRLGQPSKALATLEPMLKRPDADSRVWNLAGEAHLYLGDAAQAEAAFGKAAAVDPKDMRSRTALALTKATAGGIDAAALELKDLSAAGKDTTADMALVSLYVRQKDYAKALAAVDAIESKQPDRPATSDLRGTIELQRGNKAQARAAFERALKLQPTFVSSALKLAALDLVDKKPDDARKRFEAVLATDPKNERALTALVQLKVAAGAPKEEIAAQWTKAIAAVPDEPEPRMGLIAHHLRHGDAKLALTAAQEGVAALPANPDLLDFLGRAQLAAGETQQAMSTFNRLATMEPKVSRGFVRLAGVQTSVRDFDAAEASLRRALAIDTQLLPAQQALFDLHIARHRPADALAIARTIQTQRPTIPIGYALEAQAEISRKNLPRAAAVYAEAFRKFPDNMDVAARLHSTLVASGKAADADKVTARWRTAHPKDITYLAYLADAAMARRDHKSAERHYRDILALAPKNVPALNNLAWILATQRRSGAVEMATQALALSPLSPSSLDTLAMALGASNDFPKAIETQKKAIALAPNDAGLRLGLAKLQLGAGDKATAKAELEALARLGDRFAGHAEVQALLKTL